MTMKELAEYRKRSGVSMSELAKEIGVTKGYINNIEKSNAGNEDVSQDTKNKYAKGIHSILIKRVKQDNKKEAQGE